MLIETESNVVASAGLQQTSSFQIATSAHAFRILSSGLYSDKIGAVLREIGCNAMDAHIAAGKNDVPFEVHLPSRLTSKFYIRDFGPGLSPDKIKSLYTTYFSSSKQQSNEFTGAFGLGSKSPFSYTDSFTIVSVKGGVKTTYSAYVDQVGRPSVSIIADEPADADWQSGMMVSMPVKLNDYHEFNTKAQLIFSWFRVLPRMVNSEQIKPREFSVETEEFAVPKAAQNGGVSAVMGNVRYPVPSSEWNRQDWASAVAPVLRFKIGEIDVAASREQLEFTPKTRAAIASRLRLVREHFGKQLAEQLSAFDLTFWSGMRAANQWLATNGSLWQSQLREFLVAGGMDTKLAEKYDNLRGNYTRIAVPEDFKGIVTKRWTSNRGHLKSERMDYSAPTYGGRRLPADLNENTAILLLGDTRYVNDRVRTALNTGQYKSLITIDGDDAAALETAKLWYDFPTAKAEDLPLPADWIRPSQRAKKPRRPSAFASAIGTMALIDAAEGTYEEKRSFTLAAATAEQKYFVTPTVAWGKYTWHFGSQGYGDWTNAVQPLAQLAQFLPLAPRGIGLLLAGDVKRYRLEEKEGWKPLAVFKDVLLGQAVRDQVNALTTTDLGMVLSHGHSYEHGSPARFLAAHAKSNTNFWKALVALRPQSPLIAEAVRLGSGKATAQTNKPIPVAVYNEALNVLGLRSNGIVPVQATDQSKTLYPTFATALDYYFPNTLVTTNATLAARVVAQILEDDEQHLPSIIDLAA